MRVRGIAGQTLFDPVHDEQPFCQNLTERRRTTVKFLGQQSEMTIDDTWPQRGEMRSLLKGTAGFWTRDMPHDDIWEPNRHHSSMILLFRNHLTRTTVAMPPSLVNTVALASHERRIFHLSVVSHPEDAEEKGRRVVLGLPELSSVYSTHHDSSCPTTPQDAAVEAANSGRQRQDSSEGMSSPSGQALGQWHRKGKHMPTVWSHHLRQGRDYWDQHGDTAATDDRRDYAALQSDGGRTHRTGLSAGRDRIEEARRLLEEAHLEVQPAQNKVTEAACRAGEAMEEMTKIKSLMEANMESADR